MTVLILRHRRFRHQSVLEPASKFDARDIDRPPVDVAGPDRDRKADGPADKEAQAILKVCFLADETPNVWHEGVAKRMQDGAVDDVK